MNSLELSVVIPCLNEVETLEICIQKAQNSMEQSGIQGEVVVADNGSDDGSVEIANRMGAKVVPVPVKGYGSALMGGIEYSSGRYVIMGDADDSYDFSEIPRFVEKLREGYDLVMGCRLPSGGGTVLPGAMPFLHRWIGNPLLTFLARLMFGMPTHDVYCGLRGFSREHFRTLNQSCTGMEFATEMLIKSSLAKANITEIPITLHPDGRKLSTPHLNTFSDGWRTLRFFMLLSPRWLYLIPGQLLLFLGFAGYTMFYSGVEIIGIKFGAHTLLVASLAFLMGFQAIMFSFMSRAFAIKCGIFPEDSHFSLLNRFATLERGLILSSVLFAIGIGSVGVTFKGWYDVGFGFLDYGQTLGYVVPGITLAALSFQSFLSFCFISILGMHLKKGSLR